MTNKTFDPFSIAPLTVGFDDIFKKLEDFQKTATSVATMYPPYNIKKVDENKYVIEVAVAGFGREDLEITMDGSTLEVKGDLTLNSQLADGINQTFLHKGIADRPFTRRFTVADTVTVKNAEYLNGLLKIWLEAMTPEKNKKKIDIDAKK